MKAWWRRVRPGFLSTVLYYIVRMVCRSVRFESVDWEKAWNLPGGIIFAGWHGRTLMASNFMSGLGVWVLISLSRDGEMQNRIFKRFGFNVVRGSTGRGGARAIVEMVRILRDGGRFAFTPDGPRGPTHIVQEGIIYLAAKSGAAIVPVGVSANPRKLFSSWDSYMVPCPFGRGVMIFGDPIYVPGHADDAEKERLRLHLQEEMNRIEEVAEIRVGARHPKVAQD